MYLGRSFVPLGLKLRKRAAGNALYSGEILPHLRKTTWNSRVAISFETCLGTS
jgi:hypothetical protein